MTGLVRYAYYPFLPGVREAIQESGPDMGSLLTGAMYRDVRRRASVRVLQALGDNVLETPPIAGEGQALDELLASALTRMMIVCLGDRILATRYAGKEAARVRRALRGDGRGGIAEALAALGIPVDADGQALDDEDATWRIHFSDYLQHAPQAQEWKLVLQTIDKGWIRVSKRLAHALVEEGVRRRLERELHEEMRTPVPQDLKAALQPYLDDIGPELTKAKENWNTGDFGPIRDQAFPPCIVQLFDDMKHNVMVPHHGRFAFASFLGTIGMSADQILDYMQQLPNFSRDKSEYQIRHIAGELSVEPYTPPGCGTMQTHGICPLEKRDDICFDIKHPLSYYRRKLKRLPKPIKIDAAPAQEATAHD